MIQRPPFSYKDDKAVPAFDDSRPLMVFDGVCVMCSGGVRQLLKLDRKGVFNYATGQSQLGQALLTHYGCDAEGLDTVLLVSKGRGYIKSDAFLETAKHLGGVFKAFTVFRFMPQPVRDMFYDLKSRNRYALFGQTEYCALWPEEYADRLIAK